MTTPAGVQARSIAARMAATSVPRPPSALPPVKARGTVSPTIWRTMSAAPSATLLECETMTTPTCAAVFRVMASGSDRVAAARYNQRPQPLARTEPALLHLRRARPLQSFGPRLGRGCGERLADGLEAALHVEAVVAVADLPIELGQLLSMGDDRPCHRLDQSFAHCLIHEVLIRLAVSPPRVCPRHRRKAADSPRWRPGRQPKDPNRHRSASRNRARRARHGEGPGRPDARSTTRFPESGRSPPCGCARARCARRRSPPQPAPA